jgi:hypothetical protein
VAGEPVAVDAIEGSEQGARAVALLGIAALALAALSPCSLGASLVLAVPLCLTSLFFGARLAMDRSLSPAGRAFGRAGALSGGLAALLALGAAVPLFLAGLMLLYGLAGAALSLAG